MYIGLKNIQYLFSGFENLLTKSDGIHCLTGWTNLSCAYEPYLSHILYVFEYDEKVTEVEYPDDMHALCLAKEDVELEKVSGNISNNLSILIVKSNEVEKVYQELDNYFNMQCGTSMYGHSLLEFLAFENGLQSAVEYSFRIFRNPVFVFDTNYNLIAATWEAIENLNIHDQVVVNKRFTNQDFKMVNRQNNIHNKVRKSEIPVKAYNEELGYEQMYCAINTKKDLGHIVVSAVNKEFDNVDTEFMLMLKKFIDLQMKTDTFIRNYRGFNYEYFLKDLLEKKIATDQKGLSRMKYVNSEFSGNMYCMVVETARSASVIDAGHIRNVLESRFPYSKTIVYNGQIIAILNLRANQLITDEYLAEAKKLCKENEIYAGLSNCFQDIMKFEEFYNQALRAIELGIGESDEPTLFWYQDYSLKHIKNIFIQKESPETFCHPKMKFLMEYDETHHSELAYTLYMYLIHERNLVAAAEAMNMHRTSLVYRFKKIYSLLGDYFDDYSERMYMILSYEMNR